MRSPCKTRFGIYFWSLNEDKAGEKVQGYENRGKVSQIVNLNVVNPCDIMAAETITLSDDDDDAVEVTGDVRRWKKMF